MNGLRVVELDRLLAVQIEEASVRELMVISCRYVVEVDGTGKRAVGIEIIYDDSEQKPVKSYLLVESRLNREIIDPRRLRLVRPYLTEKAAQP